MSALVAPIVIGLCIGLPGTIFGIYNLQRTRRTDKKVDEKSAKVEDVEYISQALAGQKQFIDTLLTENNNQRQELIQVRDDVAAIRTRMEVCMDERTQLRIHFDELKIEHNKLLADQTTFNAQLDNIKEYYEKKIKEMP